MASSSLDTPDRRKFFTRIITSIQAAIGGTVGVVLGGAVLSPMFGRRQETWLTAASVFDLIENRPLPVTLRVAREDGYNQVIVKVADAKQALDVADQIVTLGFQAFTMQSFVEGLNSFYMVLQVVFGGMGAIALLVAAIGIANTMTMSILERTREIGLMKAVGATNRDVLSIFLGEAAGIGFLGGLGGVVIGWLAGQALNVLAIVYLANQSTQQGGPPPSVAVYTPAWLPLFALAFATLIGMISGLYPALRAATMIPVQALKYE